MSQLPRRPLGEPARIGPIHGRPARGTVIATGSWVSRALFFVACSLSSMACLITREPVYEEAPNLPPSVHGSASSPMNRVQVVRLDLPSPGADAGPTSTGLDFTAIVRDPNVRQRLEGRLFVNLYDGVDPETEEPVAEDEAYLRDRIAIPVSGSFERIFPFTIPRGVLIPGCNWIELHVSEELQGYPSLAPVERGDIGTGTWFVGGITAGTPAADLRGCQRLDVSE